MRKYYTRGDFMVYLSKGVVQKNSTKDKLVISRFGTLSALSGEYAELWLKGRLSPGKTDAPIQDGSLKILIGQGLIEATDESGDTALYRLLTNCVICHAKPRLIKTSLTPNEQTFWKWITQAGGKLTISELVMLAEKGITPDKSLLGKENWHSLVHAIYSRDTICDGILDAKMEKSPALADTIAAVLGLLRKKRLILI
jgi:hypothetical protein